MLEDRGSGRGGRRARRVRGREGELSACTVAAGTTRWRRSRPRRGRLGRQRAGELITDCRARRTCSSVTTPRKTPSRSTAITAPRRPRDSERQEVGQRPVFVDAQRWRRRLTRARSRPSASPRRRRASPSTRSGGRSHEVALLVDDRQPERRVAVRSKSSSAWETGVGAGIAIGWRSMMSAIWTPSMRSLTADCTSALRADCPSRNGKASSQRPVKRAAREQHPDAEPGEQHREALAELRRDPRPRAFVARLAPDERPRAIRPPSSGKAGTRLKGRIRTLISSSQLSDSSTGVIATVAVERDRVQEPVPADDRQIERQRRRGRRRTSRAGRRRRPELLAGRARVAADLCDSAEQEQLDPAHTDALPPRGESVGELVHDQRPEEQQDGGDRRQVGDASELCNVSGTPRTTGRSSGTASGTTIRRRRPESRRCRTT